MTLSKSGRLWLILVASGLSLMLGMVIFRTDIERWRVRNAVHWLVTNGVDATSSERIIHIWPFTEKVYEERPAWEGHLKTLSLDGELAIQQLRTILLHDQDLQRASRAADVLRKFLDEVDLETVALTANGLVEDVITANVDHSRQKLVRSLTLMAGARHGFAPETRERLIRYLRSQPSAMQKHWLGDLAIIGGRNELQLLADCSEHPEFRHTIGLLLNSYASEHEQRLLRKVLSFEGCTPRESLYLFECVSNGRPSRTHCQILLNFAFSEHLPSHLQYKAVARLCLSPLGHEILEVALQDESHRRQLELIAPNIRWLMADAPFQNTTPHLMLDELISELKGYEENVCWTLEPEQRSHRAAYPECVDNALHQREQALKWLCCLTGRDDLTTSGEWMAWFDSTRPAAMTLGEILPLLMQDGWGELPSEIGSTMVPSVHLWNEDDRRIRRQFRELLKSRSRSVRKFAVSELLHYCGCGDAAAVPAAIELIREEQRELGPLKPWMKVTDVSEELRGFLGQNFFLDADAWQAWWEAHRDEFPVQEL